MHTTEPQILRAADRFAATQPGIESWHCFSAGAFYDPSRLGVGPLVAVDEHVLAPGAAFAEHAHRRVDIVSWVLEGVLRHDDGLLVQPGEVLLQRTGMGIRHTESNGGDGPLRLVQMTVQSQADDRFAGLAALPIALDAAIFDVLRSGRRELAGPGFAYVAHGQLTLGDSTLGDNTLGERTLTAGDSVTFHHGVRLDVDGEVLTWQLDEAVSPSLPGDHPPDIVAALRAAGCVFAEDEAGLLVAAACTPADLAALVRRRVEGQPLEHILGWAEFCGLRIAVDDGVFVPRRRTEFLVQQAVALVGRSGNDRPTVIVDLCCGSGAIGTALAALLADVELVAADIDPAAVRGARRNVGAAGGQVFEGDLYEALPASMRGRVDLLVVNAPYVPTDSVALMPPEARLYEPRISLDGGPDGLDVQRRVIAGAPDWLTPGGHLIIETSDLQAPLTAETMAGRGMLPKVVTSTELSATVVIATMPKV